ncbi:hypothetical protein [Streptomyces arenae]|nr:hypothetical protein [Streptomyces arenae]
MPPTASNRARAPRAMSYDPPVSAGRLDLARITHHHERLLEATG